MKYNFLKDDPNFQLTIALNNVGISNTNPCPDALLGECVNKQFSKNDNYKAIDYSIPFLNKFNHERIVVILESPHIDEFENKGKGIGKAPAQGRTGENFWNMIDKLFSSSNQKNKIDSTKTYDVIFVNAIQYQCSNGKLTIHNTEKGNLEIDAMVIADEVKINKNKVVSQLLAINNFQNDLLKRIKKIKPQFILNLCSNCNKIKIDSQSLYCKEAIEYLITHDEELTNIPMTKGDHPSHWGGKIE